MPMMKGETSKTKSVSIMTCVPTGRENIFVLFSISVNVGQVNVFHLDFNTKMGHYLELEMRLM